MELLIRLYPKSWRARYGVEFEALLEDVKPGGRELANVFWEGIKMQTAQWGFLKVVAAFAIAGLIIAAISGFAIPNQYISTGVIRMSGDPDGLAMAESTVLSRTSLSSMIQNNDLYHTERARKPIDDVIEQMRTRDLHIRVIAPDAFSVSFVGKNPRKTQLVTGLLIQRLSNEMPHGAGVNLEILDPPNLARSPVSPNRWLIALLGLGAGILLGIVFAGVRRLARRTLIFATTFGMAGLMGTLAVSYWLVPNRYLSQSVIRIQSTEEAQRVSEILQSAIHQGHLKSVQINEGHLRPGTGPLALRISVTNKDPLAAQRINENLILMAFQPGKPKGTDVLDQPSLPATPVAPNRFLIASLGLGAGLLSGGASARLRARS